MAGAQEPNATLANLVLGGVAAAIATGGALAAGAELAARAFGDGRWIDAGVHDGLVAATRLGPHLSDPRQAWPRDIRHGLPGPVPYWLCTALMLAGLLAVGVATVRAFAWRDVGPVRRRRLGVDTVARLARRRDLSPLRVRRPTPGRFILGRVGGVLVATEDRGRARGRMRLGSRSRRRGDRSSVAVIGPTRCGKTANTISGVLDWTGPAILSSVKSDLMGATITWRRQQGEVRVFDPTASTSEPGAGWSPLRAAATITGAQKAARALADAGPKAGADNVDFFAALAEQLLWPMLYVARMADCSMGDVVRWTLLQDRPTEDGPGELAPLIAAELHHPEPARREAALAAHASLAGSWELDERTRSNAYATAQTLIRAWADPTVAASATREDIDLEWLLAANNTLYLCGPLHEQARLAPVFGGLLGDLIGQAYERSTRTNQPLPPTLLIMDEAGNTPTRWLPAVASTCAGIGLLLVTIWQSKAQIDAAYARLADSVITNHGTKIIFAGVSDPATGTYVSRLLGDEEVVRRNLSIDLGGERRTVGESSQPAALLPQHVLRQGIPGEGLLLHGTLPPAHLHSRPYYRDRRLLARTPDGATEPSTP